MPYLYVFIKNKEIKYLDFLRNYSAIPNIKKQLRTQKYNCLCCKSVLCPGKWSPSIKIANLIKEFEKNKIIIHCLFNRYWFMKIVHKYNLPNEIVEYIFKFTPIYQ